MSIRNSKTDVDNKKKNHIGNRSFRAEIYGYEHPRENPEHHMAFYHRHIEEVRKFFADKPGALTELCWEQGDQWGQLCEPLEEPIPGDTDFPHVNKRKPL